MELSTPGIYVPPASCVLGATLLFNDDGIEFYSDVFSVAFSPDASMRASASADGTAKIWGLSDGALLYTLTGHSIISRNEDETATRAVDFSPDGRLLAWKHWKHW